MVPKWLHDTATRAGARFKVSAEWHRGKPNRLTGCAWTSSPRISDAELSAAFASYRDQPRKPMELRDRLLHGLSEGASASNKMAIYERMGIDHEVMPSRGSFRGEVSPNYIIRLGDRGNKTEQFENAKLIAAMERQGNIQDSAVVMRLDPYAERGSPAALFTKPDGTRFTDDELKALGSAVGDDFTELEDGSVLFGDYSDKPDRAAFTKRMAEVARRMRYNVGATLNRGDYIDKETGDGILNARRNRGVLSEGRDRDGSAGSSSLQHGAVDRLFTEPRLQAYREVARKHGLDPAPIERQIRSAGEILKSALGITTFSDVRSRSQLRAAFLLALPKLERQIGTSLEVPLKVFFAEAAKAGSIRGRGRRAVRMARGFISMGTMCISPGAASVMRILHMRRKNTGFQWGRTPP